MSTHTDQRDSIVEGNIEDFTRPNYRQRQEKAEIIMNEYRAKNGFVMWSNVRVRALVASLLNEYPEPPLAVEKECDHEWVNDGRDSHKNWYKCIKCDKSTWD